MVKSKRKPKTTSGFAAFTKRTRVLLVLLCSIAVIGFIGLPLLFNGRLFGQSMPEEVLAAPPITHSPIPTPIVTPPPMPTPLPSHSPSPASNPYVNTAFKTLQLEDRDESVKPLQARLMDLGYFDYDETTDYFGTVTANAVKLFQRSYDMEETGIADAALQTLLFDENALAYHVSPGDKGSDVRSMQRRLTVLGYYEEKDNGYFGLATEEALLKFQKRNKIEQTGIMDQDVRDLLFSPKARYLVDPTPTPKPATPKPSKTPKRTAKPTPTPEEDLPYITTSPGTGDAGAATAKPTQKPTNTPKPTKAPSAPAGSYGSGISGFLAAANAQLGKPYILSEEGPDAYDCSGLVYYCLKQAGVSIGRYTAAAYSEVSSWQAINSISNCQPGDLIFYKSDSSDRVSHVAIYLGSGKIIHAATSAGQVLISSTTTDYYVRNFIIARRVF